MAEYTEEDISYMQGKIEGFIVGVARHTASDKDFDHERWENLSGTRVLYDSFPYYPSEDARREDEGGIVLCDWDDETQTKYLKEDVDLPRDRSGTLVLEDGTVVTTTVETPRMFKLNERDTEIVEQWDQRLLEVVQDVYDDSPMERK